MKTQNRARGLLMVVVSIALSHAGQAQDRNRPADDAQHPIVIIGCVKAGIDSGTFMLMNVKEIDPVNGAQRVATDAFGRDVLYVLNSSKGLGGTRVTVETDTKPWVLPDARATPITSTEPNRAMHRLDVKSIRAVASGPCGDRDVIFTPVPRPTR